MDAEAMHERLGIRAGAKVAVVNEPDGWLEGITPLPSGARLFERASEALDVIVYFSDERANVSRRLPVFAGFLEPRGILWMSTPEDSTELDEETVETIGERAGLARAGRSSLAPGWKASRFEKES